MRYFKVVFLLIFKLNIVLGDILFLYNCWFGLNLIENSFFGFIVKSIFLICIYKYFIYCFKCLIGFNGKNFI